MTSEIDIEQLGKWSQAREVSTRRGPRLLSKAKPDEAFWLAWNSSKAALQAAGVSIAKDAESGSWSALWWRELPPEVIQQRAENLIASRAADAEIEIPAPEGCRYLAFQKAGIAAVLKIWGEKI